MTITEPIEINHNNTNITVKKSTELLNAEFTGTVIHTDVLTNTVLLDGTFKTLEINAVVYEQNNKRGIILHANQDGTAYFLQVADIPSNKAPRIGVMAMVNDLFIVHADTSVLSPAARKNHNSVEHAFTTALVNYAKVAHKL